MRSSILATSISLAVIAGCGNGSDTTTDPDEPNAAQLMQRGPYEVGFRESSLTFDAPAGSDGRSLVMRVWYPAIDSGEPSATYAVAGVVEVPADGALNAPAVASDGPFPLAIYSHGSNGEGLLAYPYAELFASHGWIVLAPNHTGNSADVIISMMPDPFPRIAINRPADISAVLDWAESELPDDLAGMARTQEVFVFGHSFGAFTTLAAGGADLDADAITARCTADCEPYMEAGVQEALAADLGDPRVVAIAPQAPALVPQMAAGSLAALSVPTMLQSGQRDITTTDAEQAIPAWDGLDHPEDIWVQMPDGAHLSFISVCDDLDVGVLELFQPSNEMDGCGDDHIPVSVAVPALAGYTLGFARQHVLGEDWAGVLDGPPLAEGFDVSRH